MAEPLAAHFRSSRDLPRGDGGGCDLSQRGGLPCAPRVRARPAVSAIRQTDVVEYLHQTLVVETTRRAEHSGVPGLQMLHDDACLGVADPCRGEQGLLTVDTLDVVDHPEPSPRPRSEE